MKDALLHDTLVVILAGGTGSRLGELTQGHCKPALPFAGRYRNIDFSLSNSINSGLRRVGVLSQYRSQSLLRHLQAAWGGLPHRLGEFVELWPAQQRGGPDWYRGTADAVRHNLDLIRELGARRVLVLAGDHIYRMDYRPLLQFHLAHGGPATVVVTPVAIRNAAAFGIVEVGPLSRVASFTEKPRKPALQPHSNRLVLASMGLYVFDFDWLEQVLVAHSDWLDFGYDLLPIATDDGLLHAFAFRDLHSGKPGYWRDVGTLEGYWRAHIDLLGRKPVFSLHDSAWPLWSAPTDRPPVELVTGPAGETCRIADSLIADGARIEGATVFRSVLGCDVHVAAGAILERVVALPGAHIVAGTRIADAVVDSAGAVHQVSGVGPKARAETIAAPRPLADVVPLVPSREVVTELQNRQSA